MNFLLFGIYLILLTWLVTKNRFFTKLDIPIWMLVLLFLIKVAAGVYYGWFFTHMPNFKVQADTWRMYYESLVETEWIKKDPAGFFADLFRPRYKQPTDGILSSSHSYWNDIKSVLVVKLMALCNLLSGSRYYINVLFFEYLSFFGPVALSRLYHHYFPQKKVYIIAGAFLFPSTLLWCSGFHKEGLLFSSLAMATWLVHAVFIQKTKQVAELAFILFHILVIFLLRNYLALFFTIWCIPWLLSYRYPVYKWKFFFATACISIAMFFLTGIGKPLPNLPERLASRQQEFLQIGGESLVQSKPLQPGLSGYMVAFPAAAMNGFLQPTPFNIKKASYLPALLEIVLFTVLLINAVVFWFRRKVRNVALNYSPNKGGVPLMLFCIFLCVTVFILTGYTIPYLGAIVRYKSVLWPFIILPLLVIFPSLKVSIKKINMGGDIPNT